MHKQKHLTDAAGDEFIDSNPPEKIIDARIKQAIKSGAPFRFEDVIRGVKTPPCRPRKTYSHLLMPYIDRGEIVRIEVCPSSEPNHHGAWKSRWVRALCSGTLHAMWTA